MKTWTPEITLLVHSYNTMLQILYDLVKKKKVKTVLVLKTWTPEIT